MTDATGSYSVSKSGENCSFFSGSLNCSSNSDAIFAYSLNITSSFSESSSAED